MQDLYKQITIKQYFAALSTLGQCISQCPDQMWQQSVAKFPFSQTVFHALFYADLYLGQSIEEQRQQEFHSRHSHEFADYEQLQRRQPVGTYEKPFLREYLQHCRYKVDSVLKLAEPDQLQSAVSFPWLEISHAEMHIYNIRHIQHHAAQLILKLRANAEFDLPWVRSGWQLE